MFSLSLVVGFEKNVFESNCFFVSLEYYLNLGEL